MPNPMDEGSAARVLNLVEFSYEDPITYVRLARWEEDVTLDGETFLSQARMDLKVPKQDGTARGRDAEIVMEEIALLTSMRSTFPPVTVTLWEMEEGDESSAYILYKGVIINNEYNYNGNSNTVRVKVAGPKRRLETTISMKISRFCPHSFGKTPCAYDREANKETHTIDSFSGNQVILSTALSETDPSFWKFGGIRYNGFEVGIHKFENPTTLFTIKPIPSHWGGKVVDLLPGCDKTPTICIARGQEENFAGIGLKIPNRDVRITEQ